MIPTFNFPPMMSSVSDNFHTLTNRESSTRQMAQNAETILASSPVVLRPGYSPIKMLSKGEKMKASVIGASASMNSVSITSPIQKAWCVYTWE